MFEIKTKMLLLSFAFVAKCIVLLQSKQVILYSALLLPMIMAVEENKMKVSSDYLKTKFGCLPLEKWTVMQSDNGNTAILGITFELFFESCAYN